MVYLGQGGGVLFKLQPKSSHKIPLGVGDHVPSEYIWEYMRIFINWSLIGYNMRYYVQLNLQNYR